MNKLELLLQSFGEPGADRGAIILALDDYPDSHVYDLFLSILRSVDDSDLKIDVLKSSLLGKVNGVAKQLLADAVLEVLAKSDVVVIRQYAALSLRHFVDRSDVLAKVTSIVRDESEDIDVRYNALSALERRAKLPAVTKALVDLLDLERFKSAIERALRQV